AVEVPGACGVINRLPLLVREADAEDVLSDFARGFLGSWHTQSVATKIPEIKSPTCGRSHENATLTCVQYPPTGGLWTHGNARVWNSPRGPRSRSTGRT